MPRRIPRLRLPWLVALATAIGYAVTSVGNLSSDPLCRYLVAESLVRDADVVIAPSLLTVTEGDDHYSVFFPGQTIVFLPAAAGAEVGRWVTSGDQGLWRAAGAFASSTVIVPALAGFAVLGHIVLLRRLGLGERAACASGLVLAFATAQWVWGSAATEEVTLGACAAWSFAGALAAAARLRGASPGRDLDAGADADAHANADTDTDTDPNADPADLARAAARFLGPVGLLLAFGLVHRGTFLPVILATIAIVLPPVVRRPRLVLALLRPLLPWFLAACAIVALVPLYNWVRFGDPLDTGYERFYADLGGLWATPLLEGLAGHLISPGKSVVLYNPVLLLLVPALACRSVRRRLAPIAPALVILLVGHFVLYSKTTYWAGAFGWAVRFHVSILPLLMLPIGLWLATLVWPTRGAASAAHVHTDASASPAASPTPRRWRPIPIVAAVVIAASALVQVMGTSLNTGLETLQDREAYHPDDHRIPLEAAWTWERSPFRLRAQNVVRKLRGEPLLPPDVREVAAIQGVWNLFPIRASVALDEERRVVAALWAVWGAIVLVEIAVLVALARAWRRETAAARTSDQPRARST